MRKLGVGLWWFVALAALVVLLVVVIGLRKYGLDTYGTASSETDVSWRVRSLRSARTANRRPTVALTTPGYAGDRVFLPP